MRGLLNGIKKIESGGIDLLNSLVMNSNETRNTKNTDAMWRTGQITKVGSGIFVSLLSGSLPDPLKTGQIHY